MEEFEKINKLSEEEKYIPDNILQEILMYLYTNGLIMKSKNEGVFHIPIMITPSPIPKNIYQKMIFYQIAFNKIINKLSNDQNFLEEILTPISEKDEFVKKNLDISKKLVNYEHKQKIKLGIFRNDYLLDKNQNFLFFTEYNTIASSMGTFSDKIKKFYSYFYKRYPENFKRFIEKEIPMDGLNNIENFAESMNEAIKLAFPKQYKESIIIFIIQKNEINIFDQYSLSDELYNKYNLSSIRFTLEEINSRCIQDENGNLFLDGKLVSLFYFRAGYCENDYPNEESWKGRELIELSTAIKVPDINTFLTTFKIFQYELSKPKILMKYCDSELIINDILRFFGGIYNIRDMSENEIKELFNKIRNEPEKYILKPMKEGGGNNITGDKLKELIPEKDSEINDLIKNSVIVEKIESYGHEGLIIRNEKLNLQNSISEYSIYGIVLADINNLIINKSVSFLVRTKNKENIEGGIIEGAGAIDIPCLLDIKLETKLGKKYQISSEEIQKYLSDLKNIEENKKLEEEIKKKDSGEDSKKEEENTQKEK